MPKGFTRSTEVQSLLFDKSRWTITRARAWLKKHGYKLPKADGKGEYHRFRQRPPFQFKAGTFRTIPFGRGGIKAIVAVPRASQKNPPKKCKKNPEKKPRIPVLLVDLAKAKEIELEDGRILKFRAADKYQMCSNKQGNELWIVSKANGRTVAAEDDRAEKLFESFTGFEAENKATMVRFPVKPLERLGRAISIIYRSDKFSIKESDYIHPFKKYPTVSVDNTKHPTLVALRGGAIRVTAEGIKG